MVIPVYRVEAFLRKCVDSVVSQEIDDMEIILVDDCSPDGSGRLCDTLACSDARIRVVHRGQNGGLSAARNSGLDVATGDCITFVDSDDFLSPGTYRACLQAMVSRQADCVEFPVMKRYGSGAIPLYLVFDTQGELLGRIQGASAPKEFMESVQKIIDGSKRR